MRTHQPESLAHQPPALQRHARTVACAVGGILVGIIGQTGLGLGAEHGQKALGADQRVLDAAEEPEGDVIYQDRGQTPSREPGRIPAAHLGEESGAALRRRIRTLQLVQRARNGRFQTMRMRRSSSRM